MTRPQPPGPPGRPPQHQSPPPTPIEKIDSATRAPAPLEQASAEQQQREIAAFAAGNPGLPFQPPGDVPGAVADPNFPSPAPNYNIYAFSILLKSDIVNAYTGGPCNHLGSNVRVSAPNKQAAYNAVVAQYGANLVSLRGPCCVYVGADATLSAAAGG